MFRCKAVRPKSLDSTPAVPDLISDPNTNQRTRRTMGDARGPSCKSESAKRRPANSATKAAMWWAVGRASKASTSRCQETSISMRHRRVQFPGRMLPICLNHANFGLPENDLESPAFLARFCRAGPPRCCSLRLKLVFLAVTEPHPARERYHETCRHAPLRSRFGKDFSAACYVKAQVKLERVFL